ncbi:MAG: hypothetical protein ACFFCO_01160 [Promethearchaeota archaeon]
MPVVFSYCERCKARIAIELPADIVSKYTVFPFAYTYVHGDPPHALIIYLDHTLTERGHQVSDIHEIQSKENPPAPETVTIVAETAPETASTAQSGRMVPILITGLDHFRLSTNEFRILERCDGQRTIKEIAEELGIQFFVVMRILLDFQKRGAVTIEKRF